MRATLSACAVLLFAAVALAVFGARASQGHAHAPHGDHGHAHASYDDDHGHSHGPHGHSHGPHGHSHGIGGHSHEASAPSVDQHDRRLLAVPAKGRNAEQNAVRQAVAEALVDHDFRRALAAAQPWVQPERFDPWTLMAASDAHLELGQLDEAEALLQRVLDVKPTAPTYFRAAYLLHLRGRDEDAIAAMELAYDGTPLASTSERAWTLTELGDLHRTQGDLSAAEGRYRLALQLEPRWDGARIGLARCARARGQLSEAVNLLRQVQATTATLNELALLERALDLPEAAEGTFAHAQMLGRGDDHYARMLAHALADHGVETPEAVALARRELDVRPNAHTWDALAHALWADGQSAAALDAARRALSWGTAEPQILFHAGIAAVACGEVEQARAWLSEAYRRDPGLSWHPHAPALETL